VASALPSSIFTVPALRRSVSAAGFPEPPSVGTVALTSVAAAPPDAFPPRGSVSATVAAPWRGALASLAAVTAEAAAAADPRPDCGDPGVALDAAVAVADRAAGITHEAVTTGASIVAGAETEGAEERFVVEALVVLAVAVDRDDAVEREEREEREEGERENVAEAPPASVTDTARAVLVFPAASMA